MKKSWMLILVGALLAAASLAMSARAQSNIVYAAEFNQSANRFGTINLLNGNFTQIASIGSTLINDIAYCPTNGMLYGISNTTALVTFNQTNGVVTTVANLSVSSIESLAFRPSDGVLFGCTQSKLYTINPANGTATSVGSFGSPPNLGTTGQNIRFAQDGNLYVSNTGTNTDIYRINTTNGAATWMGEAVGYPYLMLENASSNMYGVFVNLGSTANGSPELVTLNLSSFVVGGTNANGSTHQITINLVGPGTNFPANFNFSGNVPQAVTNLTVPVNATGPSNQTTVVGSNVVFSTAASGTGPYNYVWSKNGAAISGQTNSSLTLNNVTTADAATYSVIVGGAIGTVTNSATLTVTKATGLITLGSLSQTYSGSAEPATATTTPSGLTVNFTYNGSATVPTNAGSYAVVGTINDANYQGSATGTLVIGQATGSVTLGTLSQTYNGSAEPATATTTPSGLTVNFTYNGSATVPTNAGSYTVIGTINDANYQGSATGTLVIGQATGSVTLGTLSQTYNGSAKAATATTTPSGLAVNFTYNGSATVPTGAGSYTVIGTINDANYQGSTSGTLVIGQATGSVTLGSLSQTYNGSAKAATATTTPSGLAVSFTYNGSATVPTGAGSYTVIGTINDANYQGSTTGTLVIGQATGSVTLGSLSQTYNGSAKAATATTTPSGLAVSFTYNGSATVPTGAGSYTVIGTINDANYQGSATGTLVIGQATGAVTLGSLSQTYDGTAKPATATTTPSGLTVTFSYNGSATIPTGAGSYTVVGTINDANYQGSATGTLVINAATLTYTANVASMTYGSAVPGLSGSVSGFVGTDNQGNATTGTLTFTAAATSSSGVGSYAINGTGLTANNGNYTFVQADGNATALTINALPVNLTGTRSYDGTTAIAAGILSVANKVGSDNVTVASGSGTLAGANVGSEAITSFETLALGGTAAGNYTLAGASGSVNITVSALALTVTNLLALDKVYDGTTNTTLDATNAGLAGVLNGDSVTLVTSNAVAYFADKNVGTNKPVTVTGLALAGAAAANYSLVDPTNVTADITAAGLTVSDVTAASKVYDGTTNAQLNGTATLNGGVSGDDVSLVAGGVSAAFAGPNVGTGIPVTVSGYAITGADAGNYTLTPPSDLAADITAATLTITAAANTKTYDGTTSASATPTTSGLQGSDTVTGLAESYDTKDAGTGKTLSVSAYTVNDGNGGNNYTVSTATSTAGVINQAPLTITASANTKTYDGSTSAAATPTVGGLQGSDTVTGLAETYDTKNVGTGKTLSVSAYTVNDGNGGNNYTVSTATSTAGVISKATLTITAAANTKIYDGSTSAAATPTTSGLQGSDSVTGLAETYDTKNVGTGKTLSVSAYTVNDGNGGNNYTVSTATSTAGVISKATLTITAAANTKTYDGSTSASATPTTSGLQGSDTVTGLAETYDTKNSGTGKTLSVSAYTVNDGNGGNNYTVSTATSTAGVISKATLTITAAANTKIYDGSTSAAATPTTNGLQSSDSVSGLAETYDTKNAGTGKTLSVSAYTVNDGNAGGNYTVSTVASTAGVINQAAMTITAITNTKTYDGTTSAAATPTVGGLQGSDTVTGLAETYDTKNAGTGKTLSVSAYTVNDGNAGGNYTVTTVASTAGVINQATLTITASANTKTYDGSTSAAATPTANGLQSSDSVSGLAETYDTKNVGTGKTLSVSAYTVNDGNSGNNYTVSTVASTAGIINQATLTITASANTKTYDGTTSASATPTTSGLQGSDTVTGLAETYDTKNSGTGKTLSVSAYTVNDGNSGNNYTVNTAASVAGIINKATLTITAAANTKNYDGSTSAAATPTTSGLQGSDSVTGLAETYDTKNVGTGKTLSVSAYTVNDGNSGNNYTVSTVANTAGVIDQATLTITAAANTKNYDGSTSAAATPTANGLQSSDSVTGLAETYDTKNAGTGKTLSVSAYTVNDGNFGNNYTVSTVASIAGVIDPAALTVIANDKSKMCGQPNPPLTASYNGFVSGENTNVLASPVALDTPATTDSGVGTYPITAGGVAAPNYAINYVSGKLIVNPALQLSAACASVSGNNQFIVSWPTVVGQTYQLEYTSDLAAATWTPLGTPLAGTDGIVAVTNSMSVTPQCFFRVEVQ